MSASQKTQVQIEDEKQKEIARKAQERARKAYEKQQQCIRQIQEIQRISEIKRLETDHLIQNLQQKINQNKNISSQLKADLDQLIRESDQLHTMIQTCQTQLSKTNSEIAQIKQNVNQLKSNVLYEQKLLKEVVKDAKDLTVQSQKTIRNITKDSNALLNQQEYGHQMAEHLSDVLVSIQKSSAELMLLAYDPELTVPSMITLQAMDEQGYQLCYTVNDKALTTYFEHCEHDHQIAVKHSKISSSSQHQQWNLEAETFGLYTDRCLDILDDFEYSLEDMGGEIIPGTRSVNHYQPQPKPDGILIPPVNKNYYVSLHNKPSNVSNYQTQRI